MFNNVLYYHKVREGFARIAADTELEMQAFGLQLAQTLSAQHTNVTLCAQQFHDAF